MERSFINDHTLSSVLSVSKKSIVINMQSQELFESSAANSPGFCTISKAMEPGLSNESSTYIFDSNQTIPMYR